MYWNVCRKLWEAEVLNKKTNKKITIGYFKEENLALEAIKNWNLKQKNELKKLKKIKFSHKQNKLQFLSGGIFFTLHFLDYRFEPRDLSV